MKRWSLGGGVAAALLLLTAAAGAGAAEITLRVHHFLPATSVAHRDLIEPWAAALESESDGRIEVQIFPAMQLGGRPAQLFDQVRDGIVDVVWTLPSYSPGRFPTIEVFELPFLAAGAEATSQALQAFADAYLADEFASIHPILFHVAAPLKFHVRGAPVRTLDDLDGETIRVASRVMNDTIDALGATPLGMPVPEVGQALATGVIDGTVLPWEVVMPLRVHELTDSHTDFAGARGFATVAFLLAMNRDTYRDLPDDLKAVVDRNSGIDFARRAGRLWDEAEAPGLAAARALGHEIVIIDGDELGRWQAATLPVIEDWVARMDDHGKDGAALLAEARRLIAEFEAAP